MYKTRMCIIQYFGIVACQIFGIFLLLWGWHHAFGYFCFWIGNKVLVLGLSIFHAFASLLGLAFINLKYVALRLATIGFVFISIFLGVCSEYKSS